MCLLTTWTWFLLSGPNLTVTRLLPPRFAFRLGLDLLDGSFSGGGIYGYTSVRSDGNCCVKADPSILYSFSGCKLRLVWAIKDLVKGGNTLGKSGRLDFTYRYSRTLNNTIFPLSKMIGSLKIKSLQARKDVLNPIWWKRCFATCYVSNGILVKVGLIVGIRETSI